MKLKLPDIGFFATITDVEAGIGSIFVNIESAMSFSLNGSVQDIEIECNDVVYTTRGIVDLDCIIDDNNKRLEFFPNLLLTSHKA